MKIKTKSIHYKKTDQDGVRICVMRRIRHGYDFDMWIPRLAPPEKLLKDYVINKKITWQKFRSEFKNQVLKNNKKLLRILVRISQLTKITLLCQEKSATHCHRSLILKECGKIAKEL